MHLRFTAQPLEAEQDQGGDDKAGGRREQQRQGDINGFLPVHPGAQGDVGDQGVGQADAEDRADQGVRAGGRNAEIPGAEVPGDGGAEHGEHHHQAIGGVGADQQLDRQQVDDGIGDADATEQDAEEVEATGQNHRQVGWHCLGVDHRGHRVGSVMETINEFEGQDKGQSQ
mgnify:CR=1 FL=1